MDLHTRFVVRRRQDLNCLDFLPSSRKHLTLAMPKHVHRCYLVRLSQESAVVPLEHKRPEAVDLQLYRSEWHSCLEFVDFPRHRNLRRCLKKCFTAAKTFDRGWIYFGQTTERCFVLQCNSAIKFLALRQRLSDKSWTIANERRKNILLDLNNVKFDLNED